MSHTLRGCVDWNIALVLSVLCLPSHTLRGCVDWNSRIRVNASVLSGHTLRGCVDWNKEEPAAESLPLVTPFVGVWIETKETGKGQNNIGSHPSWVCGLKPNRVIKKYNRKTSHPSWVCGLKLISSYHSIGTTEVTPFVGVWIETHLQVHGNGQQEVTPFVGVWIETCSRLRSSCNTSSHPSWVCGLKLPRTQQGLGVYGSHPSWVCGLKQIFWKLLYNIWSHTLRGCVDWNNVSAKKGWDVPVTPFVGVWIETPPVEEPLLNLGSHPSWVCGLKLISIMVIANLMSHTLRGCVDWNL